jgi:hypothetical protein
VAGFLKVDVMEGSEGTAYLGVPFGELTDTLTDPEPELAAVDVADFMAPVESTTIEFAVAVWPEKIPAQIVRDRVMNVRLRPRFFIASLLYPEFAFGHPARSIAES